MALVKCPECNKEVSNLAMQCPNCGYAVKEHFDREQRYKQYDKEAREEAYKYVKELQKKKKEAQEEAERRRIEEEREKKRCLLEEEAERERKKEKEFKRAMMYKKLKVVIPIVTVFIIGTIYCTTVVVPNKKYMSAKENIKKENYEKAIEELKTIIEYKDSRDLLKECQFLYIDKFISENAYDEALEYLKDIGKKGEYDFTLYEDYIQGIIALEAKNYQSSVELFRNAYLEDFKQSKEYYEKACVQCAKQLLSQGQEEEAIKYFEKVDYQGDEYKKIFYEKGKKAYKIMRYDDAITFLDKASDYKDSFKLLDEVKKVKKQSEYFSENEQKKLNGYWHMSMPDQGDSAGRVICIKISTQFRRGWTGWDYSYSMQNVKNNLREFKAMPVYMMDYIINNGDGTYSWIKYKNSSKDSDAQILFRFKLTGNSLEVISAVNKDWEMAIGVYTKIE